MFSKLIFTVDGRKIELQLHEVVKIAIDLLSAMPDEKIDIASPTQQDFIFDDVMDMGPFFVKLISKVTYLDPLLLVPIHIGGMDTPKKWLFSTKHLFAIDKDSLVVGWWFLMAGRLILVKNQADCELYLCLNKNIVDLTPNFLRGIKGRAVIVLAPQEEFIPAVFVKDGTIISQIPQQTVSIKTSLPQLEKLKTNRPLECRIARTEENSSSMNAVIQEVISQANKNENLQEYRFYVSDHGFLSDIIKGVADIALNFNWLNPELIRGIIKLREEINARSADLTALTKMKIEASEVFANAPFDELVEWHPDRDKDELKKIQASFKNDENYKELEWKRFNEETSYIIEILVKQFLQIKLADNKNFDRKIYSIFEDANLANQLIKRIVLASIAKQVNRGKHQSLFRPVFAYGSNNGGDKYTSFAKFINAFLADNKEKYTPAKLIRKMRAVLRNEDLNDDAFAFIPNLVGAWFIAETVRNQVSLLSGLMLMDMIESEVPLLDEMVNLYDLENALIYSDKRKVGRTKAKDLYGKEMAFYEFGGMHPMAHKGSVNQSKNKLKAGVKLSVVRQKEGALILHWLFTCIKQYYPDFPVEIVSMEQEPLEASPCYCEKDISDAIKRVCGEITKRNKEIAAAEKIKQNTDKLRTNLLQLEKEKRELNVKKSKLLDNKQQKEKIIKLLIVPLLKKRLEDFSNLLNVSNTNILSIIADYLSEIGVDLRSACAVLDNLSDSDFTGADENDAGSIFSVFEEESSGKSYSSEAIPAAVKNESLRLAEQQGKIGPREISGSILKDVDDIGNCFYEAIADQLRLIKHSYIKNVPQGTKIHDSLRLCVQGGVNFKDREEADYPEILILAKKLNLIVAIIDTRYPENGFIYHFINDEGEATYKRGLMDLPLKPLVRLAYTGNHYLSVRESNDLEAVISRYSPIIPKVKFGFFSGKLPRKFRELHIELQKLKLSTTSVAEKIEILNDIKNIAKQLGKHHPILIAADDLLSKFKNPNNSLQSNSK